MNTRLADQSVIEKILQQGERIVGAEHALDPKVSYPGDAAQVTDYGLALTNLLGFVDASNSRECYVEEAQRQIDGLSCSVWLRYLELAGEELVFPLRGNQGDYVYDIGATVHRRYAEKFLYAEKVIYAQLPASAAIEVEAVEPDRQGEQESLLDAWIDCAKTLLGQESYRTILEIALDEMLVKINRDLQAARSGVENVMQQLQQQFTQQKIDYKQSLGLKNILLLVEIQEQNLIERLSGFSQVIEISAQSYQPHYLGRYLRELANDFHTYYNAQQIIVVDANLRNARLCLTLAVYQVFVNGLRLLGISAPENM